MAPASRREKRPKRGGRSQLGLWPYAITVGVAAVVVVALIVLLTRGGDGDGGDGGDGSVILPDPIPTEIAQDGHLLGNPGAAVTLFEYTDFQCPYCREFAMSVLPSIEEEFVSTGKVRVQARLFSFLGEESLFAAQAAECANDQGRFWDYYNTLYANQRGENKGAFLPENLKRFAEALELDTAAFDSCLDSGKHASKILKDKEAAQQVGVNSVPTIFVNGQKVVNDKNEPLWRLEDLRAAIQEALGSSQ